MRKVLIVEDDEDTRRTLEAILAQEGYQPVGVEAGDDAIEYLSAHEPPCLVLLDLHLPRLSGLELLRWLNGQEQLRSVRIAVVTAARGPDRELPAFREHVVAVLEKPFDLGPVLRMVEEHCAT